MDINLPGMSGVECVRRLKLLLLGIHIVMLTVYDDSDRIFQALRAFGGRVRVSAQALDFGGAFSMPSRMFIRRRADVPIHRPESGPIISTPRRRRQVYVENLTKREADVLSATSRGAIETREIADALGLSTETVRGYLKTIYTKVARGVREQKPAYAEVQRCSGLLPFSPSGGLSSPGSARYYPSTCPRQRPRSPVPRSKAI